MRQRLRASPLQPRDSSNGGLRRGYPDDERYLIGGESPLTRSDAADDVRPSGP